jgi:hypothetical protein
VPRRPILGGLLDVAAVVDDDGVEEIEAPQRLRQEQIPTRGEAGPDGKSLAYHTFAGLDGCGVPRRRARVAVRADDGARAG